MIYSRAGATSGSLWLHSQKISIHSAPSISPSLFSTSAGMCRSYSGRSFIESMEGFTHAPVMQQNLHHQQTLYSCFVFAEIHFQLYVVLSRKSDVAVQDPLVATLFQVIF